jgi:rare lipoprotein A (peptidoglycan hydrolase)
MKRLVLVIWFLLIGGFMLAVVVHKASTPRVVSFPVSKTVITDCYRVKAGDSIWKIAYKTRRHQYQIRSANGLQPTDLIHPDQCLKIPNYTWVAYEGKASWYGPGFHGRQMANGQVYNQYSILFAHRHLPINTRATVTNLNNGKSVTGVVLDRGPYHKDGDQFAREIDLSFGAAMKIGMVEDGVIPVKIEPANPR